MGETDHQSRRTRRETGRRRGAIRGSVFVGLLVLLLFGFTCNPFVRKQRKAADRTQALNNMRSVGLAMLEFDQEFGSFPDDETAARLLEWPGTRLDLSGPYSNAYFRQLIAYGIQSEDIFFTIHPEGSHRPDRLLTPGRALSPGEVGLSYTYGLNTSSNPKTPLLLSPMKAGTHLAWRQPFGNRAAVLLLDNSVHALPINRRGEILLADGSLLLDPAQAYWHGRAIDLRHPELPDSP